jgi:hypothetical protein
MYICLEKTIFVINIACEKHTIIIDEVTDFGGPHWGLKILHHAVEEPF